jgi:hypothetical protein
MRLHLLHQRGKTPIETHHQLERRLFIQLFRQLVQVRFLQRQRLLYKYMFASRQCVQREARMAIVPGRNENRIRLRVA